MYKHFLQLRKCYFRVIFLSAHLQTLQNLILGIISRSRHHGDHDGHPTIRRKSGERERERRTSGRFSTQQKLNFEGFQKKKAISWCPLTALHVRRRHRLQHHKGHWSAPRLNAEAPVDAHVAKSKTMKICAAAACFPRANTGCIADFKNQIIQTSCLFPPDETK